MIRVGRSTYDTNGKIVYPTCEGFEQIIVIMKSHSKYYSLSPYYLKNDKNQIMENVWQFSKVYEVVPKSIQHYSRYDKTVIWEYNEERHIKNEVVLPAYWKWREKGMNNEHAVRYPVGFKNKSLCKFCIPKDDHSLKLDYVQSRAQIYIPTYCALVKECKQFKELKQKLKKGINLLIIEPDGPHQESMEHYKSEWSVEDKFINHNTMLATEDNLLIMLLDEKHSFGHGYCLAAALLDIDHKMII